MRWIYKLPLRLRSLFRKSRVEQELDEEMSFHLEKQIEENVAKGMNAEEARYAALREFGGVERLKEECRDAWHVRFITELGQDVRYGLRQLRRNPGFTAVAVLTLALGIGANTAIFSVIDAVLLRSLPVKNPAQLVLLDNNPSTGTDSGSPFFGRWRAVSYHLYYYLVRNDQSFQGIAAFRKGTDLVQLHWQGEGAREQTERTTAHLVSGNYFEVLGIEARLGRVLEASDDTTGAAPVAVISYACWQRVFHSDPAAVGRVVDLNSSAFTIVGVAPPEFFGERMYERAPDFWVPLAFQPQITQRESYLTLKRTYWLNLIGRMKPGVTRRQAQAAMDVELRDYLQQQAGARPSAVYRRAIAEAYVELAQGGPGISDLRYVYSKTLWILVGIVALVLLLACANVANLLLSRSRARKREIAVRLTVGASRGRLLRQMLTEGVLLALLGGGAGLLLAQWSIHLLATLLSRNLVVAVATEPTVLAFTFAVAVLTGLVFGMAPALRMSRTEVGEAMKDVQPSASRSLSGLTRALIALQTAASIALLAGAGLLVRTLTNLEDQYLGFDPGNVLLVRTVPRLAGLKVGELDGLYRQLLDRLNSLPQVRSATIAYYSPMSGHKSTHSLIVQDYSPRPNENTDVNVDEVGPNYFKTLGISMLMGRPIGPRDTAASRKVVVVNEAFVERYLHGRNPLGVRLGVGEYASSDLPQVVVGVCADARYESPRHRPEPFVYVPLSQMPQVFAGNIEVRTTGDPRGAVAEIRQAIKSVDSALPIVSVETLRVEVHDNVNRSRLVARLSALFGLLGLVLAAVGIYGVSAYSVAQRTHEIGIRMALGAEKNDVLRMVIGQGLKLALVGVAIGVAGALALTRFLSSLLYGVKPTDPVTFVAVSLILIFVAFLACYIPARRAANIDPMVALRYE